MRTGLKNVKLTPLTGFLDLRSPPDILPPGGWRWAQNCEVLEKDRLCATTGFRRLLDKTTYNNADLHDQLFGNLPEQPQMLFAAETPGGYSQLFAGTQNRLYSLNAESENWHLIFDEAGSSTGTCSELVWNAAANGNIVVFTNNHEKPKYHIIDQPPIGDGQSAVSDIPDLVALNVTKVGRVWTWNNITFYANVEIDGQRQGNLILWSDYNRPISLIPNSSSLAGQKTLDQGEVVLNGKELGNQFLIYTTRGIWVMSAVGLPNVFDFSKRYPAERPGDRTLAFPNTLVSIGSKHFYMGVDGVYQYDFYLPEPSRVEWIHLATKRIYDTIDAGRCNTHVGGYNLRKKAIWFSWIKTGEDCPTETFLINTEYPWTSYLDCGFTAFANWNPRKAMSLRSWMLNNCVCTSEEMEENGLGLLNEGGTCFPLAPVSCPSRPMSFWTQQELVDGDISSEDFTKVTADADSLCTMLGGVTPAELCDAEAQAGQCNAAELFVMASSQDGCLKESATVFYREFCTNTQGCGTYEQRGYRPLLRSGPVSLGAPEVLKTVQGFEMEVHPPEQTIPARVGVRLGMSADAQDPNEAAGKCVIMWQSLDPYELKCRSEITAEQHAADGTYPDETFIWPVEMQAYYLYFEIEVFNDRVSPPDTGCAVCWSRVSFYTGTPKR